MLQLSICMYFLVHKKVLALHMIRQDDSKSTNQSKMVTKWWRQIRSSSCTSMCAGSAVPGHWATFYAVHREHALVPTIFWGVSTRCLIATLFLDGNICQATSLLIVVVVGLKLDAARSRSWRAIEWVALLGPNAAYKGWQQNKFESLPRDIGDYNCSHAGFWVMAQKPQTACA